MYEAHVDGPQGLLSAEADVRFSSFPLIAGYEVAHNGGYDLGKPNPYDHRKHSVRECIGRSMQIAPLLRHGEGSFKTPSFSST